MQDLQSIYHESRQTHSCLGIFYSKFMTFSLIIITTVIITIVILVIICDIFFIETHHNHKRSAITAGIITIKLFLRCKISYFQIPAGDGFIWQYNFWHYRPMSYKVMCQVLCIFKTRWFAYFSSKEIHLKMKVLIKYIGTVEKIYKYAILLSHDTY